MEQNCPELWHHKHITESSRHTFLKLHPPDQSRHLQALVSNTHLLWWERCLHRWWATRSSPSAGSCTSGRATWWVFCSRRRPAICTRTSAPQTWWDMCAPCSTRSWCRRSGLSCWRNPQRELRSSRWGSPPLAAEPLSAGPSLTWAKPGPSCRVQNAECRVRTVSSA